MAVKVIAHRGAPLYHLENTLSSFRKALDLGVDMIELDVRVTKDGHLVVLHDMTIDRVAEGKGNGLVKHLTLRDLRKLKIGRDHIPTVEEVIVFFKNKVGLVFDVKVKDAVVPLKKIMSENNFSKKVIISSFEKEIIKAFEDWRPEIETGLLCWFPNEGNIKFALENTVEYLHPYHFFLSKRKLDYLHDQGLKVNVWTVDYAWSISRSISQKVDGIITNNPVLLNRIKEEKRALIAERA